MQYAIYGITSGTLDRYKNKCLACFENYDDADALMFYFAEKYIKDYDYFKLREVEE